MCRSSLSNGGPLTNPRSSVLAKAFGGKGHIQSDKLLVREPDDVMSVGCVDSCLLAASPGVVFVPSLHLFLASNFYLHSQHLADACILNLVQVRSVPMCRRWWSALQKTPF